MLQFWLENGTGLIEINEAQKYFSKEIAACGHGFTNYVTHEVSNLFYGWEFERYFED